jgi:hypothetical protein
MLDILPFQFMINKVAIAGSCLWSLALYLSLASIREWIITQLNRWFNFAERFLYTSNTEFEKTRTARESQNAFYASIMSILPFLVFGALSYWSLEISLGSSWGISTGILTTVGASIYELGRINGKNSD